MFEILTNAKLSEGKERYEVMRRKLKKKSHKVFACRALKIFRNDERKI